MKTTLWLLLASTLLISTTDAFGQSSAPAPGGLSDSTEARPLSRDFMSQSDLTNLANLVASKDLVEGRHLLPAATVKARSLAMLEALHVSCRLADADLIGKGARVIAGKPEPIGLYEVACQDGMGYLLTMEGDSMVSGVSCFQATGDTQSGGGPSLRCKLPANADLTAESTSVMKSAGTACSARKVKWLGHSAAPDYDYTDVTCSDGREYVLHTPAPGTQGNIGVLTCQEAAKQGARCLLTPIDVSAAANTASQHIAPDHPDLRWFESAFAKNGFACTVKNARLIGREAIKRRWVAEFECAQHPDGAVVFVPSSGDAEHEFAEMNCKTAAAQHLSCRFPHAQ